MSTATVNRNETRKVDGNLMEAVLDQTERNAEVVSSDTLGALMRAEIDVQISTAKRYPRSLAQFRRRALEMATIDEETAGSCFYSLPRGGKPIEGPSIRLAEIVASAWGNLRVTARLVSDDGKFLTAQGMAHDLETNYASTQDVPRRVTDKNGRRFNADMIGVTGLAALAIARRNAILGVVPRSYINSILAEARRAAVGDAKTLAGRRADMIGYFMKMGLTAERVLAAVEKKSIEDVGLDELATLKGMATAIKDGVTTPDDAFPEVGGGITQRIKDKLQGNGAAPAVLVAAEPPKESPPAADRQPGDDDGKPSLAEMEADDLATGFAQRIEAASPAANLSQLQHDLEAARMGLGKRYDGLRDKLAAKMPAKAKK